MISPAALWVPTQEYGLVIENAGQVEVSRNTRYFTTFTVGISICLGIWGPLLRTAVLSNAVDAMYLLHFHS